MKYLLLNMGSSYVLKIESDSIDTHGISSILGIEPISSNNIWELSIDENNKLHASAVNYFIELLDSKMQKLPPHTDVSLWYLYEYENQCNIEFPSVELKKLGELGVTLCISCWEKHSNVDL